MSWWKRLWGGAAPPSPERLNAVHLVMPGWREEAHSGRLRLWRDSSGDVLSLAIPEAPLDLPEISDKVAAAVVPRTCRKSGCGAD